MNARFAAGGTGAARGTAAAKCPVCGRLAQPASRPFCSVRCADVDLGRWLTGQYRVAGRPDDEAADNPPVPPDPDAA